jgi:hypothetical protein
MNHVRGTALSERERRHVLRKWSRCRRRLKMTPEEFLSRFEFNVRSNGRLWRKARRCYWAPDLPATAVPVDFAPPEEPSSLQPVEVDF